MNKKIKFRVNDIVLTQNNSLAIVTEVSGEDCSVDFLSQEHTKRDSVSGFKRDYNAWHRPETLKLIARLRGLDQLIKFATIAYGQKKI